MNYQNISDFDSVALDSHVKCKYSPVFDKFDIKTKGIRINAPNKINAIYNDEENIVSSSTRFPVCISMQFPLKDIIKYEEPRSLITLVMVNRTTGDTIAGNLSYSKPMGPNPSMQVPKDILEVGVQRFYYNVSLCNYLRLPALKGTYYLYATFEEFKSNTLEVTLR